ncbi:unnamed protein product [Brassica oleracea var. botrytis]
MAKEKSYVIALQPLLLLSLLLCLSSQVGVADARSHTINTGYSDSRCADKFPATPPPGRIVTENANQIV